MFNKPNFLIIGGQRCGTTWLWEQINKHPATDLPKTKEIHYFGSSELFRKGTDWYYDHFSNIDGSKITGEASTSYLYDRVPYFFNSSNEIEYDESLPLIPELVTSELPDIKIIVILRDPVKRAISGYFLILRRSAKIRRSSDKGVSPMIGLKNMALQYPKKRVLEYGHYSKYIKAWLKYVPRDRFKAFIFEDDVIRTPEKTIKELYSFLDIDPNFQPVTVRKKINKSWTWSRIATVWYTPKFFRNIYNGRLGEFLDKYQPFDSFALNKKDFEFLQDGYAQEKTNLEEILGRKIDCWRNE